MHRFDVAAIAAGLPFRAALDDLEQAVGPGAVVVEAPPGTGKTTLVPPLVANNVHGRVVVVQPRRVAARAAARRLASLSGTRLGDAVGYTVRGDRRPGSVVDVVTPGVLLRRLLADPGLDGVGAVVLDEVHERGLETDLLVGLLAEVRLLREDLLVVAMSATLDAALFADLLGATRVFCPGTVHPLEVEWCPHDGPRTDERGVTRGFLDHVARVARRCGGGTLVFLPGVHEVRVVAARLREMSSETEILELHGGISPGEQDRVTSGGAGRVIVSTALAESSLTVPGVRTVVDAGLAREPRRDSVRDMAGLVTVSASRASAQQRAGRAARLGPGSVVRCYDEQTWRSMPPHATPEVATADLTSACLLLACWGTPRGEGLALPTALPRGAVADAEATLRALGAVDDDGQVTDEGRSLAAIPTDPRLARGLLDGARLCGAQAATRAVAALADDPQGDVRSARPRPDEVRRFAALVTDSPARHRDPLGLVVGLAHPGRLARLDGDSYLLASGTRAGLGVASLAGHEWLAVADVTRGGGRAAAGTGAVIRSAVAIDLPTALLAGAHLHRREVRVTFCEDRVRAREVESLGAIELAATPVRATAAQARPAVVAALHADGLDVIGWSPGADSLRRRLAYLHRHVGAPWPDVSDTALLDRLEEWLAPELDRLADGASRVDLLDPLRRLFPWPQAAELDSLAPERLTVPSGSAVRIEYPDVDSDARPVVAVKLQECFGWVQTPCVAGVRVLFHLLSPARRPLAVTDDLASFWAGPYRQVRAEMRGRYPKHPWPEDPWSAPPTARTTRR